MHVLCNWSIAHELQWKKQLNQCHYNQVTWSFMTQNFLIILVATGVFFLKFLFFIFILTDAYIADQGGRHLQIFYFFFQYLESREIREVTPSLPASPVPGDGEQPPSIDPGSWWSQYVVHMLMILPRWFWLFLFCFVLVFKRFDIVHRYHLNNIISLTPLSMEKSIIVRKEYVKMFDSLSFI